MPPTLPRESESDQQQERKLLPHPPRVSESESDQQREREPHSHQSQVSEIDQQQERELLPHLPRVSESDQQQERELYSHQPRESESGNPIYRIICRDRTDYSLAIRGENVVFALTHPFDRSQHWMKDGRHGDTIKDSEGQPAFALVNRATGQAISHGPNSQPVSLVRYNVNSCDESVLWTMSKDVYEGFRIIRRVDDISVCFKSRAKISRPLHDGQLIVLSVLSGEGISSVDCHWKVENISPSICDPLFRPSQHTVKIICQAKGGYNLAIANDGSTVLLVLSNPKDKYQHWIKETAYGVPVKDEKGQKAFALVNKATGKAIKHGFGHNYLVQVAPFNRNYMDPSLLWTLDKHDDKSDGFRQIRMQNNIDLAFNLVDEVQLDSPLLGLSEAGTGTCQQWKIEDFE